MGTDTLRPQLLIDRPLWSQLLSVIATEIRRPAGGNSIKKLRPDEFISINRNIIYNFHSLAYLPRLLSNSLPRP